MSKRDYVNEKMAVAISCFCGYDTFKKRLEDATISALIQLEDDYLTGELAKDLKYILDLTKRSLFDGKIQVEPNELERRELVDKMLHVLLETTRLKERKYIDKGV
jgi:hypothetical protein